MFQAVSRTPNFVQVKSELWELEVPIVDGEVAEGLTVIKQGPLDPPIPSRDEMRLVRQVARAYIKGDSK